MTTVSTVMLPGSFELEISTDGGTTWAEVKNVVNFDAGNIEAEEVDATTFSSPNNFREFLPGLKAASDGSVTLNYLIEDTQHKAIRDAVGDADPVKLRSTRTAANGDDEIMTADFHVRTQSEAIEVGGILQKTFGIKMTGSPAYSTTP